MIGSSLLVVLTFKSVDEILKCEALSVMLFIMLYKVLESFESVDKIIKCDHSSDT